MQYMLIIEKKHQEIIELTLRTDKLAVPVVWYGYCLGGQWKCVKYKQDNTLAH